MGTAETLQRQLQLCQVECASEQADWDVLEAWFAELQEVQRQQKRDLTSLRLEPNPVKSEGDATGTTLKKQTGKNIERRKKASYRDDEKADRIPER